MQTVLFEEHVKRDGRMVDFAGFQMPLDYGSSIAEHQAVRQAAGLFDVSHMGVLEVRGQAAAAWLAGLLTNDPRDLAVGQILYSPIVDAEARTIDDLLVYRFAPDRFRLVVNAGNRSVDLAHFQTHLHPAVELSEGYLPLAILALQGPRSVDILRPLLNEDAAIPEPFHFIMDAQVANRSVSISRTGYTGEDGFELYLPPDEAPALWTELLEQGAAHGLVPAGLGARDSLRMEAGLPLFGHEISDSLTVLDGGLGRFVDFDRGPFLGREALIAQRESGQVRSRLALRVSGRGIPRAGDRVLDADRDIGFVTSGGYSPTFACGIALVSAAPGSRYETETELTIQGRRTLAAITTRRPPYRRSTNGK